MHFMKFLLQKLRNSVKLHNSGIILFVTTKVLWNPYLEIVVLLDRVLPRSKYFFSFPLTGIWLLWRKSSIRLRLTVSHIWKKWIKICSWTRKQRIHFSRCCFRSGYCRNSSYLRFGIFIRSRGLGRFGHRRRPQGWPNVSSIGHFEELFLENCGQSSRGCLRRQHGKYRCCVNFTKFLE